MPIEIKNISKKYNDVIAVNNISLTINDGELFSLLGVNGAGKTTLIKMLATLTKPSSGDAIINGFSINDDCYKVKELIDISMQDTAIARKLTVEENLDFYGKLNGLSENTLKERKKYVYEVFSLENVKNKQAYKLSGGYQRKLSIALSLISNPKILFLDEPTLGLDVISKREMWKAIDQLKGKVTIILTTHYMEEAQALSDRLAIMKEGNLLFVGSVEHLYKQTNKNSVEDAFIEIVTGGKLDE